MDVYNKQKPESIQSMFDHIAANYDRTNAVLSFGMHHLWNAALIKHVVMPCRPTSLVDLCAGTGEIAFRSLKQVPSLKAVQLIDFSQQMLECAQHKASNFRLNSSVLSYSQADVQKLPLSSNSIDCMTIAYGIRNVCDPAKCIQEAFRALKRGGAFGILELTEPSNSILKIGHSLYLKRVLPLLGKLLTSDQAAYTYLCNSIHSFVKPRVLSQTLSAAGFEGLQIKSLTGGIATLFIAKKPA